MTIPLNGSNSDALCAQAGTAGVIAVSAWGRIVGTDYQNLVPGINAATTLSATPEVFYAPSTGQQAIISLIELTNTTASPVSVQVYSQTGPSQTLMASFTIPANGRAEYS